MFNQISGLESNGCTQSMGGLAFFALRVRRQGFWHQELRKLRECPAHLVGFIMRRAVCDASVALRVSFV